MRHGGPVAGAPLGDSAWDFQIFPLSSTVSVSVKDYRRPESWAITYIACVYPSVDYNRYICMLRITGPRHGHSPRNLDGIQAVLHRRPWLGPSHTSLCVPIGTIGTEGRRLAM